MLLLILLLIYDLLAERERINQKLQEIIDLQTEPWGVKVRAHETGHNMGMMHSSSFSHNGRWV